MQAYSKLMALFAYIGKPFSISLFAMELAAWGSGYTQMPKPLSAKAANAGQIY